MKMLENEKMAATVQLMDSITEIRQSVRYNFSSIVKRNNLDVTIEMMEVLRLLWQKDSINQQEIVEKTNRKKASVTSLIDNMEARKLVIRTQHSDDKRSKLIKLTDEGRKFQFKLKPILESMYRPVLEDISLEEIEAATEVLQKMKLPML